MILGNEEDKDNPKLLGMTKLVLRVAGFRMLIINSLVNDLAHDDIDFHT